MNKSGYLICVTLFLTFSLMSCSKEQDFSSCPEDDFFCFEREDLFWSGISKKDMDWNSSGEYCAKLGGRLPSFSELKTLVKKCPEAPITNSCQVNNECLSLSCWTEECAGCKWNPDGKYSRFKDSNCFWTLSEDTDDENYAWSINFVNSYIGNMRKSEKNFVRCVREN